MENRQKIIENVMQNMHVMRHKLMIGYDGKKTSAITPAQGSVLRFVANHNAVSVKAIAEALQISSSAATQLIDCLVGKDYLLRKEDADDRRSIKLSLSLKAIKFFAEFQKHGLEKMAELFQGLNDEELAQYARLNEKIVKNIVNNKCIK